MHHPVSLLKGLDGESDFADGVFLVEHYTSVADFFRTAGRATSEYCEDEAPVLHA